MCPYQLLEAKKGLSSLGYRNVSYIFFKISFVILLLIKKLFKEKKNNFGSDEAILIILFTENTFIKKKNEVWIKSFFIINDFYVLRLNCYTTRWGKCDFFSFFFIIIKLPEFPFISRNDRMFSVVQRKIYHQSRRSGMC